MLPLLPVQERVQPVRHGIQIRRHDRCVTDGFITVLSLLRRGLGFERRDSRCRRHQQADHILHAQVGAHILHQYSRDIKQLAGIVSGEHFVRQRLQKRALALISAEIIVDFPDPAISQGLFSVQEIIK